jgi:hypothetical protein
MSSLLSSRKTLHPCAEVPVRPVSVLTISLFVLMCAAGATARVAAQSDSTAPASASKQVKSDPNRLMAEEIATSKRPTIYEAVDRLRPSWLRKDMLTGEEVVVYMDEQNVGGSDKLRDIPSVDVVELQYVPHADAVRRWGSDIKGSVIVVARRR